MKKKTESTDVWHAKSILWKSKFVDFWPSHLFLGKTIFCVLVFQKGGHASV